jgi:predicted O-methyltransferase YrrM
MLQIIKNISIKQAVKTSIMIFLFLLFLFFNFNLINDDIKKLKVKLQFIKLSESIKSIKINDRFQFGVMLEQLKFKSMIEIGVQSGVFANEVLSKWPSFEKYFGIDHANIKQIEQDKKYLSTLNLLSNKYGSDKIKLIRNYSTNAVVLFHDESIDFIYVDARHDYCGVYEDLNNYYPKLKCNGIMAGHDYHTVDEVAKVSGQDFGLCQSGERNLKNGGAVKGAVIQFMKEKNIQNLLTTNEGFWISYYFLKSC